LFVGCDHKYLRSDDSNPIANPNPRLALLVEAARRNATVRLLLASFSDDGETLRSNVATVVNVSGLAAAEELDMETRLGNPTGGGDHAKVVRVVTRCGRRWQFEWRGDQRQEDQPRGDVDGRPSAGL
jgi:hypothetical protein